MNRRLKILGLAAVIALAAVLAGASQQSSGDKVTDPVCGMTFDKSAAKATFDYKGQTYYFCAARCQEEFAKDPEKYLQKQAEPQAMTMPMGRHGHGWKHGMGMMPMGHGMPMAHGMRMMGPMGWGMPMAGHMMGMRMGCGMGMMGCACQCASCQKASQMIETKVENSPDGVTIKITSKDAELVKKIQAWWSAATAGCSVSCGEDCPAAKKEVKK